MKPIVPGLKRNVSRMNKNDPHVNNGVSLVDKFFSLVKRFDPHAMHSISSVKCFSLFRAKNASRMNRKVSLMKESASCMKGKGSFVNKNISFVDKIYPCVDKTYPFMDKTYPFMKEIVSRMIGYNPHMLRFASCLIYFDSYM